MDSYAQGELEPALLEETIGANLGRTVAAHAEREALVEFASGRRWTWAELDRETQAFGLAVPGGIISTTGIGGITLGGGIGWLHRKLGLSCDSLRSAQVVTADGSIVAQSVCWRAGASRGPATASSSRRGSSSNSSCGASSRTRAAANSIASGSRSSRRQSPAVRFSTFLQMGDSLLEGVAVAFGPGGDGAVRLVADCATPNLPVHVVVFS